MGVLFIIVLFIFLIAARACWVSARGRFGLKKRSTKVGILLIKLTKVGVLLIIGQGDEGGAGAGHGSQFKGCCLFWQQKWVSFSDAAANDPDFFKTPRKLVRQKWLGGLHSSYRWAA